MYTKDSINIWLDDIRPAPDGWIWAKTAEEFVFHYFSNYLRVNMVSLDHDLGTVNTGYDAVKAITSFHEFCLPRQIFLHTSNPVGRENMYQLLYSFADNTDSSCEIYSAPNRDAWEESLRISKEEGLYEYSLIQLKDGDIIEFDYLNWENKHSHRQAVFFNIVFGNSEFHPVKQWMVQCHDLDKNDERNFAAKDMSNIIITGSAY
ncbi:hypothetical protein D3C72_1210990 [compost metagenome]